MDLEYGVITLAIPKDYKKAIALALTLKEHSPMLSISIVCSEALKEKVKKYFDAVIIERSDLKGFEHKLYLDEYSPYEKTFFFDADILIMKDIMPIFERWKGSDYAVRGRLAVDGKSSFGLNRKYILNLIGKDKFSVIDGAGHAYFEKPGCKLLFDTSREVLSQYSIYKANKFADEDAVGIAMTIIGIKPKDNNGFLGSPWCAINNSFYIDTTNSICSYFDLLYGEVNPYAVHFPSFAYPIIYARELRRTYRRNNVKITGIWWQAIREVFIFNVLWPFSYKCKSVINVINNWRKLKLNP